MSWKKEAYKENLPANAIAKVILFSINFLLIM